MVTVSEKSAILSCFGFPIPTTKVLKFWLYLLPVLERTQAFADGSSSEIFESIKDSFKTATGELHPMNRKITLLGFFFKKMKNCTETHQHLGGP